jgi:hypothetical protein
LECRRAMIGETMTNAIEGEKGMQQIATVLWREQELALELLILGHSDIGVTQAIGVRRETILRWEHRDPVFRTALHERRATVTDAAAERLRGLLDQAVSVVQKSLSSPEAGPKLEMSLLNSLGVLERSRELGQAEVEPVSGIGASEVDGDTDVERVIEAVEAETGSAERRLVAGGDG